LLAKAKDSYRASQLLAQQGFYDFAGARAYYTMFYIAEVFLWEKDLAFSSHAAVIAGFGREIAKAGIVPVEFHRFLINAQNKRASADYEVDAAMQLRTVDVEVLLEQSRLFIECAEKNL
jgi:uncharacterized protein (UPF0332 family)